MITLIKSTFYKEKQTITALNTFLTHARQLSYGSECEAFQTEFAAWQGRSHSVLLNSGSSANLAVIQALLNLGKLKAGDPIGFSAVTWSTNVMPMFQLGLKPIPVDVELDTLNISSGTLEKVIRRYPIRALFLTHLLGFCGDLEKIVTLCKRNNIILIEDTCESLGSVYKGKKLGNFGLASTFSFYVGHHMSTIEGGAVCTDDEELATMLYLVRAHGWDRNLTYLKQSAIRKKFQVNSTFYSRYTFYDLGYNLRPTEITGFLGRNQLRYMDTIIKKREQNFFFFADVLSRNRDRYIPLQYKHIERVSNFAVPVICKSQEVRDRVVQNCDDVVEIRPVVGGDITKQPFFQKYNTEKLPATPNAALVHLQGLYFGNNPDLTTKDKKTILSIIEQS